MYYEIPVPWVWVGLCNGNLPSTVWLSHHTCFQYLPIAQKSHNTDYHRLPRNNIPRKNLSIVSP